MEKSNGLSQIDWSLLDKLPKEVLVRFFHNIVNGICGWQVEDSSNHIKQIKEFEYNNLISLIEKHLSIATKYDWTEEEFLQNLGDLDPQTAKQLYTCFVTRKEELERFLQKKSSNISRNPLLNFDWKLKLALGSDKISSIKELLLSLDLQTENEENSVISTELNKEELHKLILALESCQKATAQLKI